VIKPLILRRVTISFTAREAARTMSIGGSGRPRQAEETLPKLREHLGTHSAYEPTLPEPLDLVMQDLSALFGFSAASLLAPILTLAGAALGDSVVLETSISPSPLNACLDCALLDESPEVESLAQVLAQPFREEQDRRIAALGSLRPKDIRANIRAVEDQREAFFGQTLFRDSAAEASFDQEVQACQNLLYPVLLVENLPPGFIHQAIVRNGGNGLLCLENAETVRSLLKSPKKSRADFEAKARAFQNRTRESGLLEEHQGPTLVRPSISCLLRCDAPTIAGLACSPDPAVQHFAQQLILCSPAASRFSMSCGSAGVPDSWVAIITNLFLSRVTAKPRRLILSLQAEALLLEYTRECGRESQPGRLTRLAPVLAGKTALILHVSTTGSPMAISVATMAAAIALTRQLTQDSDAVANQCVSAHQSGDRRARTARLLQKIQANAQISERELQRSANLKIEELRAIVDELVRMGQVHYRQDGRIEAAQDASEQDEFCAKSSSPVPPEVR
jgi:hypothetical protein